VRFIATFLLKLFTGVVVLCTATPVSAGDNTSAIRFLEDRVKKDPDDIVALNRLSNEYLTRFRDAGNDADLEQSLKTAEQSLHAVPADVNPAGLAARARTSLLLHQFAQARDDAQKLLALQSNRRYPLEILGDALLELGEVAEAAEIYQKMANFPDTDPDAGTEVRLARLALARGQREEAKKHFAAAVELAKQSRDERILPWALVQAGQFAFSSGDWAAAEADYLAALKARPQDWPAQDHLAELRAAQGRFDESISLYTKLVDRVPRPELFQALGDVYAASKSVDAAKTWHARALAAYQKSIDSGATHYLHHLAGFYSDAQPDPTQAVRFAEEDLKLRHSSQAYDALAWALYQQGEMTKAADAMDTALKSGIADSHILYHASLIYARSGKRDLARQCLQRAGEVNSKFMSFHVHR
jgi:tetratricopeptide (TPR) repeat protein